MSEVSKDHPLERVYLILESHEVGYGFVAVRCKSQTKVTQTWNIPFIRIIDALESDILFVFKQPIELRAETVKA